MIKLLLKILLLLNIFILAQPNDLFANRKNNSLYIYPPFKHTWGVRKASPFHLRIFVGNKTKFNDPQGLVAVKLLSWETEEATKRDDFITVYGVNSGDKCIIYNKTMFNLGVYGLDDDHYKFVRPWGISADKHGNVIVTDRGNGRIVWLKNDGKNLTFNGWFGGIDNKSNMTLDPSGVALSNDFKVYVTDMALGNVFVYQLDTLTSSKKASSEYASENVSLLSVWEGLDAPVAISMTNFREDWSFTPFIGFAVVIDSVRQRVSKFALDGKLVSVTRTSDWSVDNAQLWDLTLDYYNNILITDRKNNCIHKLQQDMSYISSLGGEYGGEVDFDEPRGITIHRRLGQIFVAERQGAHYLWVGVEASDFKVKVKSDSLWKDLHVNFKVNEPAFCVLNIYDNRGRFITSIDPMIRFNTGNGTFSWDLRIPKAKSGSSMESLPPHFTAGELLPKGIYKVKGIFRATYSSRDHFTKELQTTFEVP